MKEINHFEASWFEISKAIHDIKEALSILHNSRYQQKLAMNKMGDALDIVNNCINNMVENNGEKK